MRKVRILGIAPYEGIGILLESIAARRNDVSLDMYVGDMDDGASIAKKYAPDGYNIILSRGGTAELIQELQLLPVVDIPISVYDIFRSIRLADHSQKKYAVVGFPSITKNAIFLKDMLQNHIPIFTVHDITEAQNTLRQVKELGYEMVVCDVIASSLASQFHLSSILISSGEESIASALDVAVQVATQRLVISDEKLFFEKMLENETVPVVVYTPDGRLFYQSTVTPLPENIRNILKNKLPSMTERSPQKFHYEYSGLVYAITGKVIPVRDTSYIAYYINMRKVPLVLSKNGVRYTNFEQAQNDFQNSFYRIANVSAPCFEAAEQFLESGFPIAVIGEPGTGKAALIKYIYLHSAMSSSPMSIIDCAKMNDKMWDFLTSNHNSPLSDTKTTIHIKNIHTLEDGAFYELLYILDSLKLYKRNLLLFTIEKRPEETLDARSQELINRLHCLTVCTAPLADNVRDIPNIVSLYINHLNIIYGKNIIGLEPEALAMLQEFPWEYNYNQLIRAVTELVLGAAAPVIPVYAVKQLLKKEKTSFAPSATVSGGIGIDVSDKTLEEIDLAVIRHVLNEEGGNQSRAAKRLGISRSTLWRVLQKTECPCSHGASSAILVHT